MLLTVHQGLKRKRKGYMLVVSRTCRSSHCNRVWKIKGCAASVRAFSAIQGYLPTEGVGFNAETCRNTLVSLWIIWQAPSPTSGPQTATASVTRATASTWAHQVQWCWCTSYTHINIYMHIIHAHKHIYAHHTRTWTYIHAHHTRTSYTHINMYTHAWQGEESSLLVLTYSWRGFFFLQHS
jgi:hypothetical protein